MKTMRLMSLLAAMMLGFSGFAMAQDEMAPETMETAEEMAPEATMDEAPAMAEEAEVMVEEEAPAEMSDAENATVQLAYALDTFYFLVMGAFVMWMAAGFAMLESGLVRAKNTAEILTKNIGLYAVACVMYMLMGYNIMYPGDAMSPYFPGFGGLLGGGDNSVEDVLASGGDTYYSGLSDFFFQVVFVATAMSIVSPKMQ